MEKDLLSMYKKHYEILTKENGEDLLNDLHDDFLVKYTYDAISLEGNSKMPFEEVSRLIKIELLVNKNKRSELEVVNHVKAYNKVLEMLKRNKDITEEDVKDLHDILLNGILIGGVYRNVNVSIVGGAHQPPDYIKVYDRMNRLFSDLKRLELDDFNKGIYLHANLAKIYPFLDGNGRVARLVLNYYLIKGGYLPITIPLDLRTEYFNNLEEFKVNKNIEPLTEFIRLLLVKRYEEMLEILDN